MRRRRARAFLPAGRNKRGTQGGIRDAVFFFLFYRLLLFFSRLGLSIVFFVDFFLFFLLIVSFFFFLIIVSRTDSYAGRDFRYLFFVAGSIDFFPIRNFEPVSAPRRYFCGRR
jgi:hypothetical protein